MRHGNCPVFDKSALSHRFQPIIRLPARASDRHSAPAVTPARRSRFSARLASWRRGPAAHLDLARQIPIAGQPADVHEVCAAYAVWLASAPGLPKLFINAEPGSILPGPVRDFCCTWPDQAEVTVPGVHFIQKDSGPEIGRAVGAWLRQLSS